MDFLFYFSIADGENESVTSETNSTSSWIIAPSPRFRSSPNAPSLENRSMENLLLENPTMSIYGRHARQLTSEEMQESKNNCKELVPYDAKRRQVVQYSQANRQLVLIRRRERVELASQMGIPLEPPAMEKPAEPASAASNPVPKLNKKSLKKHNSNNIRITRGKKSFKIHQCGVKAGRRRS